MAENTNPQPRGVMLYPNFYDALKDLPAETVGTLMLALMRYIIYGEVPDFDPMTMVAWTFLRSYADNDRRRYDETVERRRAAIEKRWSRERTKSKAAPPAETPAPKVAPQPVPTPPVQDEDEPPASIEWVRENILSGKNGEFVAGWAKKMYPELR